MIYHNKKHLDDLLNEELDHLAEISPNDVKGRYDLIQEISKEISSTESHLHELKSNLRCAIEEFNAALAMSLRKRQPQLSVNLDNGKCTAGYRSTVLCCWPDLNRGLWQFEPNKHGRSFMRKNAHLLKLGNQINPLVDAILDHFSRYRTLNV